MFLVAWRCEPLSHGLPQGPKIPTSKPPGTFWQKTGQNVFTGAQDIKKTANISGFKHFGNYSNSILYTFKSMQHIHYMVIYTITSCIILYSKSFMYIMYSFWSHCEYTLSTNHFILTIHTIKILFHSISNI